MLVQLYNPGAQNTLPVRMLVPAASLTVLNHRGEQVPGDIICDNENDTDSCTLLLRVAFEEQANVYLKVKKNASGKVTVTPRRSLSLTEKDRTWTLGG